MCEQLPTNDLHNFDDFSSWESSWDEEIKYEEYETFVNLLHYAVKLELTSVSNADKLLYSDLSEE